MCQAKDKGGRRCLRHAKVSQYLIRVVKFRTGADDATISAAMNELNREGAALPDATGDEATKFVDQEAFDASNESVLTSHERKIQLSQLAKAREEVKNGVKGSHLYVWKNLFKRVVTKLKLARKVAYVGAFLLPMTLASCSAGVQPNASETPRPSISVSQPATTPSTTPTAKSDLGDAVVTNSSVTDELGTYKTVKLNPNAKSNKFDKNLIDESEVKASGLSYAQVEDGQKWVTNFVASQGLDSVALDRNTRGWDEWQSKYADKYLAPDAKSTILSFKNDSTDRAVVVLNDPNNSYPELVRDGGARVKSEDIQINALEAGKYNGRKYMRVNGTAKATYAATDKGMIESIKKLNPGSTDAKIKAEYPKLYNGVDGDVDVEYTFDFSYTIVPEGSTKIDTASGWAIAGVNNTVESNNIGLK